MAIEQANNVDPAEKENPQPPADPGELQVEFVDENERPSGQVTPSSDEDEDVQSDEDEDVEDDEDDVNVSEPDEDGEGESHQDEVDALCAMAQLDLEAAAAYEIAAQNIEDGRLSNTMLSFCEDHRRHVDELARLVRPRDLRAELRRPDPQHSVLVALASTMAALDPSAALDAMIGAAHLTKATYEAALGLVSDDGATATLRRGWEDEQRHLEGLIAFTLDNEAWDTKDESAF